MLIRVIGEGGKVLVEATAFGRGQSRITGERRLLALLAFLYAYNVAWLRAHPEAPRLYDAGIKYKREARRGLEEWLSYPELLARKIGDCEDLGSAKAAERTVRDEIGALPALHKKIVDGYYLYHVDTKRADGRREDPSRVLGMGRG